MADGSHIYQLMVLTAWSDGHLHELEQRMAGQLLLDVAELRELDGRDRLASAALERLRAVGVRAAVDEVACELKSPESRRTAILCCAHVLAADGRLALEEFAVMSQLRRHFGFSVAEITQLISHVADPVRRGS